MLSQPKVRKFFGYFVFVLVLVLYVFNSSYRTADCFSSNFIEFSVQVFRGYHVLIYSEENVNVYTYNPSLLVCPSVRLSVCWSDVSTFVRFTFVRL